MKIYALLAKKKPDILEVWFESILATYPSDDSKFLKGQRNPFAGSIVGQTISEGINGIFDQLIGNEDPEKLRSYLDDIIRIRAVQEFEPSQAISFIFLLKKIIRDELNSAIRENDIFRELMELESKIDSYAYMSFDIYMKCREKLFELRANEMRNWTYRVVKESNMYRETEAE